jgi:hypothetical protein
MRLWKISGLTVVALVVVAGAVMASVASAAMTLPEFVTRTSWTGTSGPGVLKASGVEIACKEGTNSGEMEASKKLGTFLILFTKCSSAITSTECNTSGSPAGLIEVKGTWHIVLTTISGSDEHLIWFLITPFTTKCGTVNIETKGTVLGGITPANTLTKVYTLKVETPGGAQEYTTFENDNGEKVSAVLLSAAALGFHAATEKSEKNILTTSLDTLIIN